MLELDVHLSQDEHVVVAHDQVPNPSAVYHNVTISHPVLSSELTPSDWRGCEHQGKEAGGFALSATQGFLSSLLVGIPQTCY